MRYVFVMVDDSAMHDLATHAIDRQKNNREAENGN